MIVLVMLKVPWAKAMVISGARFKKLSNHWIKPVNGTRKIIQITVPMTLKATWAAATRLAAILAPKEAIIAVIVVPMLSPKSTGRAP